MKNLTWIILALAPIAVSAHASDRIGNGGDALVCPGKVEMLDSYQARTEFGLTLNENRPGMNYLGLVNLFLDRLNVVNPTRAQLYRGWLAKFEAETERLRGITLIDIPDTGAQAIPAGCRIEQIAVQRDEQMPGQKRYAINADLWDAMNEFNRAALVLHELIYRERLNQGAWQHSIYVRYFNAHLISENFPTLYYLRTVMFAKLEKFDMDGNNVNIGASEDDDSYSWSMSRVLGIDHHEKINTSFLTEPAFQGRECERVSFGLLKEVAANPGPLLFSEQSIGACTEGRPIRVAVQVGRTVTIAKISGKEGAGYRSSPAREFAANYLVESFSLPGLGRACPVRGFGLRFLTDAHTGKNWVQCDDYRVGVPKESWKLEIDDFTILPN